MLKPAICPVYKIKLCIAGNMIGLNCKYHTSNAAEVKSHFAFVK